MQLIYSTAASLFFSIPPSTLSTVQLSKSLKIPLRRKSGHYIRNHSRRDNSTSSLFWNRRPLECSLSGQNKKSEWFSNWLVERQQLLVCPKCAQLGCVWRAQWSHLMTEATPEILDYTVVRKWKWLFVNGCEGKSPSSYQDGKCESTWSGIMSKNRHFNGINTLYLLFAITAGLLLWPTQPLTILCIFDSLNNFKLATLVQDKIQ